MSKPAQIKTKVNEASVENFIQGLKNEQQRKDSEERDLGEAKLVGFS
ncbi:MAG: hypothetical protein JNK73_06460 [Bacteroidia bacterium]|nr:hypothetical protein [Bacteroidia bacterium]